MIITQIIQNDAADRFRSTSVTFCSFSFPLGKRGKRQHRQGNLGSPRRNVCKLNTREALAMWEMSAENTEARASLRSPRRRDPTGIIALGGMT